MCLLSPVDSLHSVNCLKINEFIQHLFFILFPKLFSQETGTANWISTFSCAQCFPSKRSFDSWASCNSIFQPAQLISMILFFFSFQIGFMSSSGVPSPLKDEVAQCVGKKKKRKKKMLQFNQGGWDGRKCNQGQMSGEKESKSRTRKKKIQLMRSC